MELTPIHLFRPNSPYRASAIRRRPLLVLFCAVAAALVGLSLLPAWAAENELTDREKDAGWKLLFDGKTLNGWKVTGKPEGWAVEDGTLHCTVMGGRYLHTEAQYDDFVLSAEFKIAPGTNSGIFFRWSDLKNPVHTGIEMAIDDSAAREVPGTHDTGAIYDIVPPKKNTCKPAGEWNHAEIRCLDNQIEIKLNGEKVSEMDLNRWTEAGKNPDGTTNKFKNAYRDLPRIGHIGLQDHGGKVWYRNVKLRPLKK